MARPTLFGHRKLLRLARALGNRALAIGYLEILWNGAYESGEAVLGDAVDVESLAGWDGEPGLLARALLDAGGEGRAGFLEDIGGGLLLVHDFWDHAPKYVKQRAEREQARQDEGKTLSDKRREAAMARWAKHATEMQTGATDSRLHATGMQTDANVPPPAPAPAPAPAPQKQLLSALVPVCEPRNGKPAAAVRRGRGLDAMEGFEEWYGAYPRKKARGDAEKAWKQTASSRLPLPEMLAARDRAAAEWRREGRTADKIPYPASYLRAKGFLDIPDPAPEEDPVSPDFVPEHLRLHTISPEESAREKRESEESTRYTELVRSRLKTLPDPSRRLALLRAQSDAFVQAQMRRDEAAIAAMWAEVLPEEGQPHA